MAQRRDRRDVPVPPPRRRQERAAGGGAVSDPGAPPPPADPLAAHPVPGPDPGVERRPRALRIAIQLLGFCIGIALLAWCASVAFSEKNRAQQARIADAAWTDVALLVLLSLTTLALN